MNTTVVSNKNISTGHTEYHEQELALKHSAFRSVIKDNSQQIVHCLIVTTALTIAIYALLPAIARFWTQCITLLIEWLQLNLSLPSHSGRIPAITAPPPFPLQKGDYGWHIATTFTLVIAARLILRPPFRSLIMLIGVFHLLSVTIISAIPSAYPYSIFDHTRWIATFTTALIVALPLIMAFTHAIIERNHERRVFGILLIWAYLIVSMPIKLVAHALLIQSLTHLITPTLFVIFGPALDICLLTAIYAYIVTWRHNSA